MGTVRTILGDIDSKDLGMTSMHEHTIGSRLRLTRILMKQLPTMINGGAEYEGGADIEKEAQRRKELGIAIPAMTIKGEIASMKQPKNEAGKLRDVDFYANELAEFKKIGGVSICDCSPSMPKMADIGKRKKLAEKSGVNIVIAAGFYVRASMTQKYIKGGESMMLDYLRDYVENGDRRHGCKPGCMKAAVSEITDGHIVPEELMAVDACAKAAKENNFALHIHTAHPVRKTMIVDLAKHLREDIGIDPSKVIFCHMDSFNIGSGSPSAVINEDGYAIELPLLLAEMGFNVGLDTWSYAKRDKESFDFNMKARAGLLKSLIDNGYVEQITLGHDFMARGKAFQNGETGYTLFPSMLKNSLREDGYGDAYEILTVKNPARILEF